MSGPDNLSKLDRLRARDGDNCWLCGERIDFNAIPNSSRACSLEHLIALSRGGTGSIENLVLCHPTCNRRLGDRSLQDKIRMREKQRRKAWKAARDGQWLKAIASIQPH